MTTLVVGGSGAIGAAVVNALLKRDDEVHVLDRDSGVDACDPAAVHEFVESLTRVPTRLVHVAGSVGTGGLLDTDAGQWRAVLDDNLTSAYVVCRELIPGMVAAGSGSIVLMSSVNGRHGGNRLSGPAYAAAKAGIVGLGRNIAKEFGRSGVRVNIVAPGPVASRMTERLRPADLQDLLSSVPAGRLAQPCEVAETIIFLLEDRAGYINGATVDINGGMWMG